MEDRDLEELKLRRKRTALEFALKENINNPQTTICYGENTIVFTDLTKLLNTAREIEKYLTET